MNLSADLRRRSLLGAVLLGALLATLSWQAAACEPREPTRETGPGPHDFSFEPAGTRLWQEGEEGQPLFLRARVLDGCGEPVAGAQVEILHANRHGDHEPDRWRTRVSTDERGEFEVVTVYPGYTGGLPRHVHFIITHPAHARLVTRLFFKNDPAADHGVEDLAMVLEEVRRGEDVGWIAGYEFVLAPK